MFGATKFIFEFLKEEESVFFRKSLEAIESSSAKDSPSEAPIFNNLRAFYNCFKKALENNEPLVGYLYGSAFKSANLYDFESKKGKVLSRSVDLQERMEYETYSYLQEHLRALGINFHFVVIRDTFHAISLDLGSPLEKISKDAPEIKQYGKEIHQISEEAHVRTFDLQDLRDEFGKSLDRLIDENLDEVIARSKNTNALEIAGIKGFLSKEYAYEAGSSSQKNKQAVERAKRYVSMKTFTKEHEASFLIPTFTREFGANINVIPFSIHVEDYLKTCAKVPLRTMSHFLGGCNAQHQLPLLQRKSDETYKFYTIRSDYMNKLNRAELTSVGPYKTMLYSGDEELEEMP